MSQETFKKPGLICVSLVAGALLTLSVQSNFSPDTSANASEAAAAVAPPKAWTMKSLNTMKLEDLGKIDWMKVESGGEYNSETAIFEGENIVLVWDSGPAKLIFETPSSYDEFVVVLKGELILTDKSGNAATYKTGDMFMLPKGFMGTWDMTEDYRELIVVDTKAYKGE